MKELLIMGLPVYGKTTFTLNLKKALQMCKTVEWLNADSIRSEDNDWDFSIEGKIRQSMRMSHSAAQSNCDFIAPIKK